MYLRRPARGRCLVTPQSPSLDYGPMSRSANSRTNPVFAIGNFYIGGTYTNKIEEV